MRSNKLFITGVLAVLAFALVLASCQSDSDQGDPEPPGSSRAYNDSVKKAAFTGDTATLSFDNLNQNDIYLVKVNTSGFVAPAANTGRALNVSPSLQRNEALHSPYAYTDRSLPPMGHPGAQSFNANPPPITEEMLRSMASDMRSAFVPPQINDARTFWVESYRGSGTWLQKPATLRASGNHANIWIMNDNRRAVSTAQANAMAEKFDLIYPLATDLLGFEYGGGPGGDGGRDGDPKIQILVHDILDARGNVSTAGYFSIKDYFTQAFLDATEQNLKTNQGEIFYINAGTFIDRPDYIYGTLIHELQHLINFNVKTIQREKASELWYNEMLAMMAEDVIMPLIGIASTNQDHVIGTFIPLFLEGYNRVGLTEFYPGDNWLYSYSQVYAFGAYLMRNYGGPALLREILANNASGIDSITQALQKTSGATFEQALSRYGEAMVFSGSIPRGAQAFDKTVSSTVNGTRYTAHAFDIWSMRQWGSNATGPMVFDLNPRDMRPHSVLLQSSDAWKNVSGTVTISLERPDNAAIELYLMVR